MCGIVALVRKQTDPVSDELSGLISILEVINTDPVNDDIDIEELSKLAKRAISVGGVINLVKNSQFCDQLRNQSANAREKTQSILDGEKLDEDTKNKLIEINDSLWRIEQDACIGADQISDLITQNKQDLSSIPNNVIAIYRSINLVLRSLDRIEVRGRDSAGISFSLTNVNLDEHDREIIEKRNYSNFTNRTVREALLDSTSILYFVYKRAAEIGELGDNVKFLRDSISSDEFLFDIISRNTDAHEMVMAHTRWASMGVISEDNTHPLDMTEQLSNGNFEVALGALNGDIDNHDALRAECDINPEITTDAKLIPVLYSHERKENNKEDVINSFRKVVSRFEGSTAVSLMAQAEPESLFLALRGGGQGLFVGLGENEYLIASEPYGVVEVAEQYVRVDGETPHDPNQPVSSRGQIFCLHSEKAGSLEGLVRIAYDGQNLEVNEDDIINSEVTTRDIDRGSFEHYLWKEINEAPRSFSTTLHGKFERIGDNYYPIIIEDIVPDHIQEHLKSGKINQVFLIGQGTAAIAAQSCEYFFNALNSSLNVKATLATELSGFALKGDMSNVLAIAVSQSGTTTDTNRTVDLLKDRGASIIAIVNRRGSDLTSKADGVCYTSSGRDVEMSVASTKAFYAQVAASAYLSIAIEQIRNESELDKELVNQIVDGLYGLPELMAKVLANRERIGEIAKANVLSRRSWATVGNGANTIAAREIRIKSSELCYKAIAEDSTEDKKHIDLSSEPLIVVCATGLDGSNADDVAKEVAIYKAHKACPIVITDDVSERFDSTDTVITVPKTNKHLSFILSVMAGHIFGYESARAIDSTAKVLREARGALADLTPSELDTAMGLSKLGQKLATPSTEYFKMLADRQYDAILDASDAANLTKLFVALTPPFMPALLADQCQGVQTPQVLANCAVSILTRSIDQLTRPIDAIRHQAKTVTVGISRSDDTLLRSPSVSYLLEKGIERDTLQYPVIRTLLALDEMVASITGHTRYEIQGDVSSGEANLVIIEQVGSAKDLKSRISDNPKLRGTKSLTAREQVVWITQGKSDMRNVILIPEVKRTKTTGITLLHIDLQDELEISLQARKRILEGYKQRLFALRDAVTEQKDSFDETILEKVSIMELLTKPVVDLAEQYWL